MKIMIDASVILAATLTPCREYDVLIRECSAPPNELLICTIDAIDAMRVGMAISEQAERAIEVFLTLLECEMIDPPRPKRIPSTLPSRAVLSVISADVCRAEWFLTFTNDFRGLRPRQLRIAHPRCFLRNYLKMLRAQDEAQAFK